MAMNGLKIDVRDTPEGLVCIDLAGYLDAHTHGKLEDALEKGFGNGRYRYIVDVNKLEYISSAGAGVFIGAASTCQEHGGNIVLVNPTPAVREIFELLGVLQLFPVVKELEQAVASF